MHSRSTLLAFTCLLCAQPLWLMRWNHPALAQVPTVTSSKQASQGDDLAQRLASNRKSNQDSMLEAKARKLLEEAKSALEQPNLEDRQLQLISKKLDQVLLITQKINDLEIQKDILHSLGWLFFYKLQQYSKALECYQRILELDRRLGSTSNSITLHNIAETYSQLKQYPQALEYYYQSLASLPPRDDHNRIQLFIAIAEVYRQLQDPIKEIEALEQVAQIYEKNGYGREGDPLLAYELKAPERLLTLYRQSGKNRLEEARVLQWIAGLHQAFNRLPESIEYAQQALSLYRQFKERQREAQALRMIASSYLALKQFSEALSYVQQAILIYRDLQDKQAEIEALWKISDIYSELNQYSNSLEFMQQLLKFYRQVGDRDSEIRALFRVVENYLGLKDYPKAKNISKDIITLSYNSKRYYLHYSRGDLAALVDLTRTYLMFNQYSQATQYAQEASQLSLQFGNLRNDVELSLELGHIFFEAKQYFRALEYALKALSISRHIGNSEDVNRIEVIGQKVVEHALLLTADTYKELKQYPKALEYYQQLLKTSSFFRLKALRGMADVYWSMRQYPQALKLYQQLLSESKLPSGDYETGAPESELLRILAERYEELKQYDKALEFYQEWFRSYRLINSSNRGNPESDINDFAGKVASRFEYAVMPYEIADVLKRVANAHWQLKQYSQALKVYQEVLTFYRKEGSRQREALLLSNIGENFLQDQQPELAIAFYKNSVNLYESIRGDLKLASQEKQANYANEVAPAYRNLADILLQQNRILEAQEVLDLLKVQELQDYLQNVRGTEKTAQGVLVRPQESAFSQELNALTDQAIALGKELAELEKIAVLARTPDQQERIVQIRKQQGQFGQEFRNFLNSPRVKQWVAELKVKANAENFDLEKAKTLQDNLKRLQQDAVILYPLVLDDRLELVLVTPYAPPFRRTVAVKRTELNEAIRQLREDLTKPTSNPVPAAQKLYNWLIKPLEADLAAANTKTIIYAPDGQLRYIPLAALHNGNQWLVERYRINNITALSLIELNTQPQTALRILAAAYSKGRYEVSAGDKTFVMNGLPYAGREVANLAKTIPGTTEVVNQEFNPEIVYRMNDYSIVHLATHAAFVIGQRDRSFILFGNGAQAFLPEVENWPLSNVDLIVLSACQTGVGDELGNGVEILGFGYLMQKAGARAAIASLWSVDDGGTQALMNAFYTALQTGQITKAEALRQAQIALITGDYTTVGGQRGSIQITQVVNQLPQQVQRQLSHPYYWAPFILIGNGL